MDGTTFGTYGTHGTHGTHGTYGTTHGTYGTSYGASDEASKRRAGLSRMQQAAVVDGMVADLKARFAEHKLSLPLFKQEDFVYMLRSRKLLLSVNNDKLMVRVGGGVEDLLVFLERVKF